MICHECLITDQSHNVATALCRFCFVALCKPHLIELYRDVPTVPQYSCRHRPAYGPGQLAGTRSGRKGVDSAPPPERVRELVLSRDLLPGLGSA